MNQETEILIAHGNEFREQNQPDQALKCYATALINDPESFNAFNNYGNVLRECGYPQRALPFLQHAAALAPDNPVANFNIAVCLLLMGDYARGWPAYESRWQYEHLAGTLPLFQQPRWTGQDLKGKTILVLGEQGHGDNIQFSRFLFSLNNLGARVAFQTTAGLVPLFAPSEVIAWVGTAEDTLPEFDYWIPLMSIPAVLGVTLENLPKLVSYLGVAQDKQAQWSKILGPKTKLRVGFCWSGRKDSWINRHKSMPFETMLDLIQSNPQYDWINLQIDATAEEEQQLIALGQKTYPGAIQSFADTAALMMHLDVVLGVDTAVSHLAGALGRPTWIMLNHFAVDWRWLLNRGDSPWYPSARLFRQPAMGNWDSVIRDVSKWLTLFKV